MAIPILGDVIREVGGVIREIIPDADKRMELEVRLAELADQADAREDMLLQGQIEVNKVEAGSGNLFVAGWRPFIGWTSGVALAYTWIVAPAAKALFHLTELPIIPPDQIYPIVLAMLGIGAQRTYEKVKGVAGGKLGSPAHSQSAPESSNPSVKKKSTLDKIIPDWLK